jgi:hypothetical protein
MKRHDPAALVRFLDERSAHTTGGHPVRLRKTINGQPISETDARMIRRWRKGDIKAVTEPSARALLRRFKINPKEFTDAPKP